jgi:hypothetical protein
MSCGKGQCGFTMRVEAGWCGSNRFNTDINTGLKSLQKFLNTTQKFFRRIVITESSGIDTGYDAGGTGSIRFQFRMDPVRNPAVCDRSISNFSVGDEFDEQREKYTS